MSINIEPNLAGLGEIVVWGDDSGGQITADHHGYDFKRIVPAGDDQCLAIRDGGSLKLWGISLRPKSIAPLKPEVEAIKGLLDAAISLSYILAINHYGAILHWGDFLDGSTIVPPIGKFRSVTAGANHGVAIDRDGHLHAWGNGEGAKTPPGIGIFTKVRARSGYTIALRDDGRMYIWGTDINAGALVVKGWIAESASLGHFYFDGPFKDLTAGVVQADLLPAKSPHVLGLYEDGRIKGWGANSFGEADGEPKDLRFQAVAAGKAFSVGLSDDNTVHVWGDTSREIQAGGKLGRGLERDKPSGVFGAINAGGKHAMALRSIRIIPGPDAQYRPNLHPSLESRVNLADKKPGS